MCRRLSWLLITFECMFCFLHSTVGQCLFHTADTDKTKLSHLVCVGGVNRIGDKTRQFCLVSIQFPISTFSAVLNIFETEQSQIGNWVETRQNCLVLSPIPFTPPIRTKQDKI